MNQFFTFEPSEFVVLEDSVEVDETVPRAEAVRFYTLEEQTTDAFERILPKDKRITAFERGQLQKIVDNFRDLYNAYVVPTADDYFLREPARGDSFPWIHPIGPTLSEEGSKFNYETLVEANAKAPNYYSRMIAKLPKPFDDQLAGDGGFTFSRPTEVHSANGPDVVRVLPVYSAPRTIVHEDGSTSIALQPYAATEQRVHVLGYKLDERKLPIPEPLEGHPFFTDNKERTIYVSEPLVNIVPSVEAVLRHGVPVTSDPYREAAPYLKLYDVQLADIPWSAWKMRFPPANPEEVLAVRTDLKFPDNQHQAPGPKVLEAYRATYNPGIAPREWLLRRDDGGEWVVKALLSAAIDNGSVAVLPGLDLPLPALPPVDPRECELTGLSFADFSNRGILRRKWDIKKGRSREEDIDTIQLTCVPLEFVRMERARVGHTDRIPWKEGVTDTEMKKTHLEALRKYRFLADVEVPVKYPKVEAKSTSQKHLDVLTVLNDPYRLPEDKLRDANALLRNAIVSNNVYTDADGLFVACKHTLAYIAGDAARDARAYYDMWSVAENGFHTCKFCGQTIDAVEFDAQAEYDGYDHIIRHAEALDSGPPVSLSSIKEEATALSAFRSMFIADNAGHMICFLLLSLLQVLPEAPTLNVFLKALSELTGKAKGKLGTEVQILRCKAGVAITALLLQAHIPTLLPRRSFGSKPLVLSGYPRDTDAFPSDEQYTIVDSLLFVLRNTFEAFPTAIDPLYRDFVREVLNKNKKTRGSILNLIKGVILPKVDGMKKALAESAAYVKSRPPTTPIVGPIPVVMPPPKLGVIRSFVRCPSARPILAGATPPQYRQEEIPMASGIRATSKRVAVEASVSERTRSQTVTDAQVRELLKDAPSNLPFAVSENYRTNLLLASSLAMFAGVPDPSPTVDTSQSPAILRDLSKGLVYQLARKLQDDGKLASVKTHLSVYTVTTDVSKEQRTVTNISARERLAYVKRMGGLTDMERQVYLELAKRGMAPIIITASDRDVFAAEALRAEQEAAQNEYDALHGEMGVGAPPDLALPDAEDRPAVEVDYEGAGERVAEGHDPAIGANFQEGWDGPF